MMKIKEIKSSDYIGNPYGVIVPFSVTGRTEGAFEYDVYDSLRLQLDGEMEESISDYLTDNFFRRIDLMLARHVKELGYVPDPDLTRTFLLQYRTERKSAEDKILPSTRIIEDITKYTDLTDTEFDTDEFPVFATVEGGRLISVCGVNGLLDTDTVEIAVETIDSARGKGYAGSNVCAMVDYLVDRGYKVAYQCYPDNLPSVALANSCGLPLYSRDYHYVCYEKDE